MDIDKYLKNPCGTYALPFWKERKLKLPDNMKVVHNEYFEDSYLKLYRDVTYFRLIHDLKNLGIAQLQYPYEIKTVDIHNEVNDIVYIINNSYEDIKVNESQVEGWTKEQVYDENLWIFIRDKEGNKPVALGIADLDKELKELKEGILEWIQVLPEYRAKGFGQVIVNELLVRLKEKADFVTVSGQCMSESKPEKLYRRCGFEGNDVWHVMYKR